MQPWLSTFSFSPVRKITTMDHKSSILTFPPSTRFSAFFGLLVTTLFLGSPERARAQDRPGASEYVERARFSELSTGEPLVLPNDLLFGDEGQLIVVDERQSSIIQLDGRLIVTRSFGSEGEGPQEFRRPGPIGRSTPSRSDYALWDRMNARLTLLTPNLDFRSSHAYPLDFRHHGFIQELVSTDDDEFVIAATTWPMAGYNEDSRTRVLRVGRDGVETELSAHTGIDVLTNLQDPLLVSVVRQPFGSETRVRFERDGRHYWVGATVDSVLTRHTTDDGRIVGSVCLSYSGPLVTDEDRELFAAAQEEQLARALEGSGADQSQRLHERFKWIQDNIAFPERKPIWEDFALDEAGIIWVRLTGKSATGPRQWVKMSANGNAHREFTIPHRGEIFATAVHDGRIVVTEQNELDVWEIVEYGPRGY